MIEEFRAYFSHSALPISFVNISRFEHSSKISEVHFSEKKQCFFFSFFVRTIITYFIHCKGVKGIDEHVYSKIFNICLI